MAHEFDRGPVDEPFATLVRDYPGKEVYPAKDFRIEWGPIFHRGRLDGSARVLVLGQDPAASETIARRILVGEAGRRIQGFLAKLGIDRSYVMVNTFLYSVFGQGGGNRHKDDPKIAAYRHRWLQALMAPGKIEAVILLGQLSELAWAQWLATPEGAGSPQGVRITHPTQPEGSSKNDPAKKAAAMKVMLAEWNDELENLKPQIKHPDVQRPLRRYGTTLKDSERRDIPEFDMPAGLPEWMRGTKPWSTRTGTTTNAKRRTIRVKVPPGIVS
jgi:hypothetical protein